jgi:glycosyltransferase involved in cell wall biosynthesis
MAIRALLRRTTSRRRQLRLGVIGAVTYPEVLDERQGDARTWAGVSRYFDEITVIASTRRWLPRRKRIGRVRYVLVPKLPRALDLVVFQLAASTVALRLRLAGVRVWAASDPLRSTLALLPISALPGTRMVVHVQGQLLNLPGNRFGVLTPVVEAVSRAMARRADVVRAVGSQIAADAVQAGVDPQKVVVVGSRCDTRLFDPARWKAEGAALRASLPGDPGAPVIGFLGSLNGSKGIDVLRDAVLNLNASRPVRLAVAGDGPLRPLLAEAARLRGAPSISLLGRLPGPDVPRFLSAVDLLALPSYDEGQPRAVLEGLAMARPVVASAVGGVPELIQHGVNGLLVPPGDRAAFVEALKALLDDDALRAQLGQRGRQSVMRFDIEDGLRRLAAVHGGRLDREPEFDGREGRSSGRSWDAGQRRTRAG